MRSEKDSWRYKYNAMEQSNNMHYDEFKKYKFHAVYNDKSWTDEVELANEKMDLIRDYDSTLLKYIKDAHKGYGEYRQLNKRYKRLIIDMESSNDAIRMRNNFIENYPHLYEY